MKQKRPRTPKNPEGFFINAPLPSLHRVTLEELTISNMWEGAALDEGGLVKYTDLKKELY